jgi:phage FluMu protein Com
MSEPIPVMVKCPFCGWRILDKLSPTSGLIRTKCPRCRRVVQVDLSLRRVRASM